MRSCYVNDDIQPVIDMATSHVIIKYAKCADACLYIAYTLSIYYLVFT